MSNLLIGGLLRYWFWLIYFCPSWPLIPFLSPINIPYFSLLWHLLFDWWNYQFQNIEFYLFWLKIDKIDHFFLACIRYKSNYETQIRSYDFWPILSVRARPSISFLCRLWPFEGWINNVNGEICKGLFWIFWLSIKNIVLQLYNR